MEYKNLIKLVDVVNAISCNQKDIMSIRIDRTEKSVMLNSDEFQNLFEYKKHDGMNGEFFIHTNFIKDVEVFALFTEEEERKYKNA